VMPANSPRSKAARTRRHRDEDDVPEPKSGGGMGLFLVLGGIALALLLVCGVGGLGIGLTIYAGKGGGGGIFGGGGRLTKANAEKIKGGMAEAEVVNLIGRPDSRESKALAGFPPVNGEALVYKKPRGVNGFELFYVNMSNGKVYNVTGML